jgi:5-methylcytosine-specific restriction endonuclease McrA
MKKWAFILLFGLIACNIENRQKSKAQLYLFKHPEFSAGYCAEQFPDKPDSVIVHEIETITDTLWNYSGTDTIRVSGSDTIRIIQYKTNTITKIQRRDSIIYRENRAEQERLQLALFECQKNAGLILADNNSLKASLATWRKTAKIRWWWIALLIGGFVGTIAIKIFGKTKLPI